MSKPLMCQEMPKVGLALIYISMIRLMLKQLTKAKTCIPIEDIKMNN